MLARGEVGKVGVSIAHKGDMHTLLDGIPLDEMNTSMTINATAAWLLGLYVTVAEENGVERSALNGHDPERHHQGVPLARHLRLPARALDAADRRHGRLHRQRDPEAGTRSTSAATTCRRPGATPVQEIAYALSTAIAVLDEVKARGQVAEEDFPKVFGRISFFVNAGVRFIEEHAKLRAMGALWEEIGRERYGVTEPKFLRFRYGVQVNSLGLTEAQPENNVPRIVLEALAVTLGRDARARAIQLPAWNEALGLPRPWDQQWSLRIQQILANETDLLEYPDIFEGSKVMEGLVEELAEGAARRDGGGRRARRRGRGGPLHEGPPGRVPPRAGRQDRARRASRSSARTASPRPRTRRSPPATTAASSPPTPRSSASGSRRSRQWQAERDQAAVDAALERARRGRRATSRANIMPATIDAAKAGATTGEWAEALREVFGDYRGPTGVDGAAPPAATRELLAGDPRAGSTRSPSRSATGSGSWSASPASTATPTAPSRSPSAPATSAWR